MQRELVRDYLENSGMNPSQAEALSLILAEMATRSDLERLKADLTWRMIAALSVLATLIVMLDAVID